MSVQEFKLYCISTEEFTDEQVAIMMSKVTITCEEEVMEFTRILKKYRPNLAKSYLIK